MVAAVAAGLYAFGGRALDGGAGVVQTVVTSTHAQDEAGTDGDAVGLWYVRVHPRAA